MSELKIPSAQINSDVQLSHLLSIFIFYKKFILLTTAIFSSCALLFGFISPNIYQSNAIFEAEIAFDGDGGSSSSGISGAFSEMAGISMAGTSGNMANLATATITSRDFFKHLIDTDEAFLPKLVAVKKYDSNSREIVYDSDKYNSSKNTWVNEPPSYIQAYSAYQKAISIDVSRKTGFITITSKHKSPIVAAYFIDLIFTETNLIMRKRDMDEAQASLDYLYIQLNSVNQQDVLNTISGLIGSQLRKLTLANIKENYLLDPIDSSFIPEYKVSPKRLQILLVGTLLGLITSLISVTIWYFGLRPLKEKKSIS